MLHAKRPGRAPHSFRPHPERSPADLGFTRDRHLSCKSATADLPGGRLEGEGGYHGASSFETGAARPPLDEVKGQGRGAPSQDEIGKAPHSVRPCDEAARG